MYRLITRGAIEEKVYHRQIYKHFLTNKILKNPQQRRFFKARDMKDLFVLIDDKESGSTETSNIFGQLSEDVNVVGAQKDKQDKQKPLEVSARHADGVAAENDNKSGSATSNGKGKEKADHSDGDVDEETGILRSLFGAHGIHVSFLNGVIVLGLYLSLMALSCKSTIN